MIIGLLSFFKKKDSNHDYLLASQLMPAWLVALSAVATANSVRMFIGMIGYTYLNGLSSNLGTDFRNIEIRNLYTLIVQLTNINDVRS